MPPLPHPTSIRLPKDLKTDLKTIATWRKWELAPCIVNALREWTDFQLLQMKQAGKKK